MAVALQDYMAPDCRFLNIYRGQVVYVFSKLKGRGRLFWGGSVSLQSVRGMVMGYEVYCFPSEEKVWVGVGKTKILGIRKFYHLMHFLL